MARVPSLPWKDIAQRIRSIRPGLWMVPLTTFVGLYLYRPFVLGFYSDDWGALLGGASQGAPFGAEQFLWRWTNFARPLMNIEVYLGTSIFGKSAVAWHFFLIALIAISYFVLRRFLLALGARPAVATVVSTLWLVFPWALGYRAWPICSAILLSTICFLAGSVALLKQRLWAAVAWNAASMLLYEAFYLQFVVVLLIMIASPETRRWALRKALPALLVLQAGIVVLNRLAAAYAPDLAKSYHSDWYLRSGYSLVRLPLTLAEAISGGRAIGLVVVAAVILFALVSAVRVKERQRRVTLVSTLIGLVIAALVLGIAGYLPRATGTASRTFVCFDVWLVVLIALCWERPLVRARWGRWLLWVGTAAVLAVLVVSTVLRTVTWQRHWDTEQEVLRRVPVESAESTDPEVVIVFRDFPFVEGRFPPFGTPSIMSNAVRYGIPGVSLDRTFYPAKYGVELSWDGESLRADGYTVMKTSEVWLWRWPAETLEPVESPGVLVESETD